MRGGAKPVLVNLQLGKGDDLRSFALDVVDIFSRFTSSLHSFGKVFARTLEASLSHRLQFSQFTLFGVQLTRSAI